MVNPYSFQHSDLLLFISLTPVLKAKLLKNRGVSACWEICRYLLNYSINSLVGIFTWKGKCLFCRNSPYKHLWVALSISEQSEKHQNNQVKSRMDFPQWWRFLMHRNYCYIHIKIIGFMYINNSIICVCMHIYIHIYIRIISCPLCSVLCFPT